MKYLPEVTILSMYLNNCSEYVRYQSLTSYANPSIIYSIIYTDKESFTLGIL